MAKKKNIVDIPAARRFLFQVYGLKTSEVTEYHLRILHPELRAYFNWYHTRGTLTADINDGQSTQNVSLGKYIEPEDVAIRIQKYASNLLQHANCPYYRTPRGKHTPTAVADLVSAHRGS